MMKHILSDHGSTDASQALKIKKKLGLENGGDGDWSAADEGGRGGGKPNRYFCTICPYRTAKGGMLTFHHSYHQPSSQNRYKCKLCPYYVCAPGLLHPHMKIHEDSYEGQTSLDFLAMKPPAENTTPSSLVKGGKMFKNSPKRNRCEKCPYTSNSKKALQYHKQLHLRRPAAKHKCKHCDYWVTHSRLLCQHTRLHGQEYQEDSIKSSPSESLEANAGALMNDMEIADVKHKLITKTITASLSPFPSVSPMKIATLCSNRPGYILSEGAYKKLHQCSKCPYTNVRSRNVRLHELMHGWRRSEHPLMRCPHCDYCVGAKGLLSHHIKVHSQQYRPDPMDSTTFDLERKEKAPGVASITAKLEDDSASNVFISPDIPQRYKVDTLLEISRFKKYSCEKCPYASGKLSHFKRHLKLHGSQQPNLCQYCDYAVPSMTLLQQHQRNHLMPNPNLLSCQSISNLKLLKEVPADVALAGVIPHTDSYQEVTVNVTHDHLELYEHDDTKKLYRCDLCPYANVRRDHLLTHQRFHLSSSQFQCPYCDYSAPKKQPLTQHIELHFCPLPELSEWLMENGMHERAQQVNDVLTQALEVAEKFQTSSKRKLHSLLLADKESKVTEEDEDTGRRPAKKQKTEAKQKGSEDKGPAMVTAVPASGSAKPESHHGASREPQPSTSTAAHASEKAATEDKTGGENDGNVYICQYCDRKFPTSTLLVAHESRHLIGNHF